MSDRVIVRRITETKVIVRQTDVGPKVIVRNVGPKGEDGDIGPVGPGVATGGTAGQFLRKLSGTNYDTAWTAPATSEVAGLDSAQATQDGRLDALESAGPAASALDDLTDVTITAPANGQAVIRRAGVFVNDAIAEGDVTGLVAALAAKADQTALDSEETDRIAGDDALDARVDVLESAPTVESGTGWFNGDGVPDDGFGLHGNYYLHRTTGDVYRKEWKKPAAWTPGSWSPAAVLPDFQAIAAKALFLAPLLEGSGLPYDLVSNTQASDPDPAPALPSPTWGVKDELTCKDGTFGGFWDWDSPPLPAMDQPFSVLQVFQGTGFVNLPKINVENFADAKGGGLDPYYGTTPDAFQPSNAYSGLYWGDDEPSRGPGWHATVVTLVSRGVAGAFAIDGAPLSEPIDNNDDGTLLTETALAPTTFPLHLGSSDDRTVYDPTRLQAAAGVFSELTQEEANLVSGDPFGVVWPATDTSPRTTWVRILEGATQAELDAINTALSDRLDVVEPLTPSSGEKAALVGTSGTPGSGNKYVTDGDARNTNARTPTAHVHPESDVTNLVTDLAAKAPLASPALTGTPTGPTVVGSTDSTTKLATTAFVQAVATALSTALVNAAPSTLDTLKELADALGDDPNFAASIATSLAGKQPLDATLTAIAGLVGAANKSVYFTNTDVAALYDLTAFGRTLAALADNTAGRTALGLVIGTDVQAQNANLAAFAALTLVADRLPYANGSGTLALATFTAFGRTLGALADAAAGRTALAVVPGTDVEAWSAKLDALVALTWAADKGLYFTSASAAATFDLSSFIRTLLDDATQAAARTTLGLTPGTDVQAFSSILAALVAFTGIADGEGVKRSGSGYAGFTLPVPATASVLGTVKILGTPADAANPTVPVQEQFPGQARLKIGATVYLTVPGVVFTAAPSASTIVADTVYYNPFVVGPRALTLDSLVCEITTVGAAGKKGRMAVYAADADDQPLALKVQTAEFAVDALAVITMGSLATALPPGRYLTAITSNGSPNARALLGGLVTGVLVPTLGTSPVVYRWSKTRTYAAFPDPGVAADTVAVSGSPGFYTVLMAFTP